MDPNFDLIYFYNFSVIILVDSLLSLRPYKSKEARYYNQCCILLLLCANIVVLYTEINIQRFKLDCFQQKLKSEYLIRVNSDCSEILCFLFD